MTTSDARIGERTPLIKGELHAYVGRQAIFDRRLDVVGYELLYRERGEPRAVQ